MYKFNEQFQVFSWDVLGDISLGRESLGGEVSVSTYRLLQYAIKKVITDDLGAEKSQEIFRKAGVQAGMSFSEHFLDKTLPFNKYVVQLQQVFEQEKIGILKVERFNPETFSMTINVSEDLDCSGLPVSGESVCDYDEGFIAGILLHYSGKQFSVREIDCWASGGRVCRFSIHMDNEK